MDQSVCLSLDGTIADGMICAKDDLQKEICYKDLLQYYMNGKWILIGIIIGVHNCDSTEVPYYVSWIQNKMAT